MDERRPSVPRKPFGSSFLGIPIDRRPRSNSQRSQEAAADAEVDYGSQPSIRIRRTPSAETVTQLPPLNTQVGGSSSYIPQGRQRSLSAPQRPHEALTPGVGTRAAYLPEISETSPTTGTEPFPDLQEPVMHSTAGPSRQRPAASSVVMDFAATPAITEKPLPPVPREAQNEYGSNLVDILDVVDPEVSTLSTLTNVQNSLFIPELGSWLNRRPTYTLTRRPTPISERPTVEEDGAAAKPLPERPGAVQRADTLATLNTITSHVNDQYFAVLPHGVSLPGWSAADKQELNDHVRHMLHSRRSKFKRSIKGFGQYVRRPLGLFVTVYATLITLFGLAWVLFLIGWINIQGRQLYIINVIDNVLVALFAVVGDGLAPFRAVDTYHMLFIAHYHRLTMRLRKKKALPKLQDKNDLPSRVLSDVDDPEKLVGEELSVLTPEQQKKLAHHQKKFSRSHSFYKPHETITHHAFPLRLLVAIVILLDCHSLLQISLGTCTWAISYHVRPFALTTVILCCSITCNITAGVLITVGDRKTRKKDVVEKMFRQELTAEAMDKIERKREKERERDMEMNIPCVDVPPPLQHIETPDKKAEREKEEGGEKEKEEKEKEKEEREGVKGAMAKAMRKVKT